MNPLSQVEVEQEIVRLSRVLDDLTEQVADASRETARSEVAYKLAHARALLHSQDLKGTVGVKEAQAVVACEQELWAYRTAEAELRALQETGRNVRAQLDSLRSINANVRSAVDYSRGEG